MANISKIKLPGISEAYDIVDATALHSKDIATTISSSSTNANVAGAKAVWDLVAGLGSVIVFKGVKDTVAEIKVLTNQTKGWVWLAKEDSSEWICIDDIGATPEEEKWEKLGTAKTHKHKVTAAGTNATSSVTGTFESSDNFVKTSTTKYLSASITNVGVGSDGTASAITSLGTPTTVNVVTGYTPSDDTFVKSYPGVTSKLVKTNITPAVSNGTVIPAVAVASGNRPTKTVFGTPTTASKVTIGSSANAASKASAGTPVLVAKTGSAVSVATGIIAGTSSDLLTGYTASVDTSSGILSFTANYATVNTSDITPAVANGSITPYTFTGVSIPTISASDVSVPVVSSNAEVAVATVGTAVSVATVGDAVTVATGAVSSTGTGATVMTGLGTPSTADALTALGTPATVSAITGFGTHGTTAFLTGVKVTSQPTVSISAQDSSDTGRVAFVASTSSAKVTGAISGTAAAQVFTGTEVETGDNI